MRLSGSNAIRDAAHEPAKRKPPRMEDPARIFFIFETSAGATRKCRVVIFRSTKISAIRASPDNSRERQGSSSFRAVPRHSRRLTGPVGLLCFHQGFGFSEFRK
jgi:hypothetical protein